MVKRSQKTIFLNQILNLVEMYKYLTLMEQGNILTKEDQDEAYQFINAVSENFRSIFFGCIDSDEVRTRLCELLVTTRIHQLNSFLVPILKLVLKEINDVDFCNEIYIIFENCFSIK